MLFACSQPSTFPTCYGDTVLGPLQSPVSQRVAVFPDTWTSAGLPARALGFSGVCSYWRNTPVLYKVIAGQPDDLTWPDPGIKTVSVQWPTTSAEHHPFQGLMQREPERLFTPDGSRNVPFVPLLLYPGSAMPLRHLCGSTCHPFHMQKCLL